MTLETIHAVRTPHQAERLGSPDRAIGEPVTALPIGRMAQDLALGGDGEAALATRAEVWVATREAVERAKLGPEGDATAERRVAMVSAYDAAIGWLARTGVRSDGKAPVAGQVRGLADAVAEILERASLHDARGLAWRARRRAETGDGATSTAHVVVTGLVPGEIDAIAAIEALHLGCRRAGGGARILLPRPDEAPGDGARPEGGEALATYLEKRWGTLEDAPEIEWLSPRASRLEVERIEAPTISAEAREVAAAIARAVAAGVAPEDIAVVVPRADDPLAGLLAVALADAGIPVSREGGDPIERSPEASVTLDLLAMASGRITRDGLADMLRAPGLHAGSWVGAAHEADAARIAAAVAHRLRSIPVAVDRAGGARIVEALEPLDPHAAAAIGRLVASTREIGALRGRTALEAAWRDLAHRVRLGRPSASELGAALHSESKARRVGSRVASARLGAIADGARGAARVLDTARALADAESRLGLPASLLDATDLLAEVRELVRGASAASAGSAPRAGAVRIATARDLVGLAHTLVVISGLGAGAYSATEVRGLVDEEALGRLPELHRPPPLSARKAARTMELSWLARDADHVLLTRRAGGAGSHDEAPHRVFVALGRTGEDESTEPSIFRAPASGLLATARPASPRDAVKTRLACGAPASIVTGAAAGTVRAAQIASEERTRFFLDPRAKPGPFSGAISARKLDELRARFGGDTALRPIAVTHVERAARCAFAGFASRVLRARRVEDALEDANPRERGTLVHGALFAAFEALRAAPPSEGISGRRARAEQAAIEHTLADAATPLRREAILAAVRDAMAVVDLDLDSGDAAFYALGEQRFGVGSPPPWDALRLDGAGEEPAVWVDGQIDRIDRAGDGRWVRIVDYKTGKLPRKKDEHQRSLQLALYADAVQRWASATHEGGAELSGRYVEAKRGAAKVRDVGVDDEARATARRSTRDVVLGLWSGNVGARAIDPRMCRRCEARDLCRKPAVAVDDDAEGGEADAAGEGPRA